MSRSLVAVGPAPARPRPITLRALIADRDRSLAEALGLLMRERGWRAYVLTAAELSAGFTRPLLTRIRPDVVLADPVALSEPATVWLPRISAARPDLPVVLVTRSSTPEQRMRGLRLGADHWLTKPIAAEEIVATIETVTRPPIPGAGSAEAEVVRAGELRIDPDALSCDRDGIEVRLTPKEFGVLAHLAAHRGAIVAREDVFARVWGRPMAEHDRTIDVYVRRVRVKLAGASPGWGYIHTHLGRGYRFDAVLTGASPGTRAPLGIS